ncbi:MAG: glutamine-hydrolyzing GMP synthase [Thermofilum sp.]
MRRHDAVLVLDFGSQYSHLIARRVREQGVYSEILPHDVGVEEIESLSARFNVKGIVLSGGPASVLDEGAPGIDARILELGLPVLGICYGHQLLARIAGGRVGSAEKKEYGATYVTIDKPVGVLKGLERRERVWMSHGDVVFEVPEGYEVLAHSENTPVAAFRHKEKPIYGLQWHPEVSHTDKGAQMIRNFLFEVCGCEATWRMEHVVDQLVEEVRAEVGESKAIIALSGGVDSSVAAALAARALGDKLTAVFVDTGFMREGEPEAVKNLSRRWGSSSWW